MKIATFAINNINARLPTLLRWLKAAQPDVACWQELKCPDPLFPADQLRKVGYHAVWRGQKTWNGVAILSRGVDPVVTRTALPGDRHDTQSRYLEPAVDGILIWCIYLPNGNPQPGPIFDYKLAGLKRLHSHALNAPNNSRASRSFHITWSRSGRPTRHAAPHRPRKRRQQCLGSVLINSDDSGIDHLQGN